MVKYKILALWSSGVDVMWSL